MAEQILLSHADPAQAGNMVSLLSDAGFNISTVADLAAVDAQIRSFPALLLLDAELARKDQDNLEVLSQGLQLTEVPCLLFSSNGTSPTDCAELQPISFGIIRDPSDRRELLTQVSHALEVKRLRYERHLVEARLLEKQQELEESLRSAAAIQQSLLPNVLPWGGSFRFAWRFLPCSRVGGDLLNLLELDEELLMAYLLDVSGHGVSAAMVTVSVYQCLSLHSGKMVKRPVDTPPYYEIPGPSEVLAALEEEYPFERFEKFFTISYLLLNRRTGALRYSNGGHPPPILLRRDGSRELLDEGGSLIGMGGIVPFTEGQTFLHPGDRLFLYSDGITEYPAPDGELFGEARFQRLLEEGRTLPLEAACAKVVSVLDEFGGGLPLHDDLSLLSIEHGGT